VYSFSWVNARRLNLCADVSEHTIQKQENHPKERIQNSEHGESLKSMKLIVKYYYDYVRVYKC